MRILAIETSCDETAIAIIEAKKIGSKINFKILGNEIASQIAIHTQYGGVFPMMAKREHDKNIFYVLEKTLKKANFYQKRIKNTKLKNDKRKKLEKILEREQYLSNNFIKKIIKIKKPKIDVIVVTTGPGLEPALWVGISFAKALAIYWDIPIISVNHMEGHIFSIFPKKGKNFIIDKKKNIFPMLSLLVSGGHTELILVKNWQQYEKIGQTRDDAAGEAFDKVARMLGLPYPGGPEISKLAEIQRCIERKYIIPRSLAQGDGLSRTKIQQNFMCADGNNILSEIHQITFPRPMINSKNYDFSFSGLKTAVLYLIRDLKKEQPNILQNDKIKRKIAEEFEDAVIETLVSKTIKAIKEYEIKTLTIGGGVSANKHLQNMMKKMIKNNKLKTTIHFPSKELCTDNALMIAIAGYFQYQNKKRNLKNSEFIANGNLSL